MVVSDSKLLVASLYFVSLELVCIRQHLALARTLLWIKAGFNPTPNLSASDVSFQQK